MKRQRSTATGRATLREGSTSVIFENHNSAFCNYSIILWLVADILQQYCFYTKRYYLWDANALESGTLSQSVAFAGLGENSSQANARPRVANELDTRLLDRDPQPIDGLEMRTNRCAFRSLEPTDGRNRDTGMSRELMLLPSEQRPSGFYLACHHQHRLVPDLGHRLTQGRRTPRFSEQARPDARRTSSVSASTWSCVRWTGNIFCNRVLRHIPTYGERTLDQTRSSSAEGRNSGL